MNDAWYQLYPQAYCVFEPGGCSDHVRCRILLQPEQRKPRHPFKFTNALVDTPGFMPMLKDYLSTSGPLYNSTSAMFRQSKKLKDLKPLVRKLSKENLGDIEKKTKTAWIKLCECQGKPLTNPSQEAMKEEATAYERWMFLSRLEEKIVSHKEKLRWLNVGDGNNKQFYQAVKTREIRML